MYEFPEVFLRETQIGTEWGPIVKEVHVNRTSGMRSFHSTDVQVPSELSSQRHLELAEGYFLLLSGPELGRRCTLAEESTTIGRAPRCTHTINDPEISRVHIQILHKNGEYWMEDTESTNGTLVNGKALRSHQLEAGDILRIGNTTMKFQVGLVHQQTDLGELFSLCARDPLTGAFTPNHYAVLRNREEARATRFETGLSELRIHVGGDSNTGNHDIVMWHLGRLLLSESRTVDVVCRETSHSLLLLLPHTGKKGAAAAIVRIQTLIQELPSDLFTPETLPQIELLSVIDHPTGKS